VRYFVYTTVIYDTSRLTYKLFVQGASISIANELKKNSRSKKDFEM